MAKQRPILGDDAAYGAAWSATPFADRRRITRAVNRGEVLDDGVEAQLAVMTSRRQVAFWRWGWLIGPAVTLLQAGSDLAVFFATMAMTTAATGGLSWFFLRRARRAIVLNLPLAEKSAARAAKKSGKGAAKPHPKSREAEALAAEKATTRRWWTRRT